MIKENVISLCDLEKNQQAIIVAITAGHKAAKRLADSGLTPSTTIKIIRKTIFCGPMEIQVRGTKMVLGKGVAAKIFVKKL
jgi:DtxR family transcriptional regulator, Mn-dependent transcriptional regulator